MNRRLFGAFGALTIIAGLTLGSCKSDPLSDADGTPATVVTDFSYLQMPIGSTATITSAVLDARTTPLEIPVTFSACSADITVATDTSYHPIPAISSRAIVTAVTAAPSCVVAAAGGVADTVTVSVLPQGFGGTFSSATPKGGDTLTINATSLLQFDPATVTVTFTGGTVATIVSKTATALKVLVPFGASGPMTIAGIAVTYAPGVIVTLPTTNAITVTGDHWAADGSWQTAPDWTGLLPAAAGQTTHAIVAMPAGQGAICPEVVMAFGSTGPCSIFKVTLADSTALRFRVDWVGTAANPDVDLLVCSDTTLANFDGNTGAPCDYEGFGGATGAKPQTTNNKKYAAGTWYFVIETFGGTVSANHFVDIIKP